VAQPIHEDDLGKRDLLKMGNRYLRKLLVVGAHAVLYHRKVHTDAPRTWANRLMETKPFKLVSAVHIVGGIIGADDTLMLIVPDADTLTVEAKVAPQDIDQLHLGQAALFRFSAFNQRTTPQINGSITRISADIPTDQPSLPSGKGTR
jgi:hypothetical protein